MAGAAGGTPSAGKGRGSSSTPEPPPPFDLSRYEKVEDVGEGGFGKVSKYSVKEEFRGEVQEGQEEVAVKVLKAESTKNRERSILKELMHRNIVKFLGDAHDLENRTCLVTELCDADLGNFIKTGPEISESEGAFIARQIALALHYMHTLQENVKIIHRDLKPSNVLLCHRNPSLKLDKSFRDANPFDFLVKVTDFGLSRFMNTVATTMSMGLGTMWFMPPELLKEKGGSGRYEESADVYSFGATLYVLMTKAGDDQLTDDLKKKAQGGKNANEKKPFSKELQNVLRSCLSRDPSKRPTAREILSMEFFARSTHHEKEEDKKYHMDSLEVFKELHGGQDHLDIANALTNIGLCHDSSSRWALDFHTQSLEMRKRLGSADLRPSSLRVGICLQEAGKYREALGHFRDCLSGEELGKEIVPEDASIYKHMGDCHSELGDKKAAKDCYKRSRLVAPEVERLFDAQERCFSDKRRKRARAYFQSLAVNHPDEALTLRGFEPDRDTTKEFRVEGITVEYVISSQSVKDVLYNLTYYFDEMPEIRAGNKQKKKPLLVNLLIGGEPYQFVMQQAGKGDRQIFVGYTMNGKSNVLYTYDQLGEVLSEGGKSSVCSGVILEALSRPGHERIDWRGMSEAQRGAAKELMVQTHLTEAAVPAQEDVSTILQTLAQNRNPTKVRGVIGGTGKVARLVLREIQKGRLTFLEAFNKTNGRFLVSRSHGKNLVKAGLYRYDSSAQRDLQEELRRDAEGISEPSSEDEAEDGEETTSSPHKPLLLRKLSFLEKALEATRELGGKDEVAASLRKVGDCLLVLGKYFQAKERFQESLDTMKGILGKEAASAEIADLRNMIGICLHLEKKHREALEMCQTGYQMRLDLFGKEENDPDIAESLGSVGLCLLGLKKQQEAQDMLSKSLDMFKRFYGEKSDNAHVAAAILRIGRSYLATNSHAKALSSFQEASAMLERALGPGKAHPDLARCLSSIGDCHKALEKHEEALKHYQMSLKTMKQFYGEKTVHPEVIQVLKSISDCHGELNRVDSVEEMSCYLDRYKEMMVALKQESLQLA